jgi:acyl-CoA oxidase
MAFTQDAFATVDAELAPFLPLLYVAWADGELEPEELAGLCSRLRTSFAGARLATVERWLDATRPPTEVELAGLLDSLRRLSGSLPRAERLSMTALSRELATRSGRPMAADEERALAEIEEALGLAGRPLLARLLPRRARAEAPQAVEPPRLDVAGLAAHLDGDIAAIRGRLETILLTPEFALAPASVREEYRRRVLSWCRSLAAEGVSSLSLPRELGGAGDLGAFQAALEVLAYHDLSLWVKFGVQFGLFAGAIQQLGTAEHHRRFLPAAVRLDLPGCFAMTETGHGSNVAGLETTATYDAAAEEFVVATPHDEARKDFIGGAARDARLAVVFAQLYTGTTGRGVHAFLVPIRGDDGAPAPGVRIEDCGDKLGLNGVDNGILWFDHVRIPRHNLLDRFGSVAPDGSYSSAIASDAKRFFVTLGTLVGGRVNVAIAAGSAAKKALAIAVRYGAGRRQFAPAGETVEHLVLDYLSHQRRLLPRLATTYALHFALRFLARSYLEAGGGDRRPLEALAAGLKAYSTWHTTDTIQACREACGGAGYMSQNQLAALKADTDVFTTFEGDNTVLCQLLVKGLLTGYRQQYADMTVLGLLRHLGGRAALAAADLNPVVTRLTDDAHLRGIDFQRDALSWREARVLSTLARRLKRRLGEGMDAFLALQECGDHVLSLARAHVESILLERFAEGVESCPDGGSKSALDSLRSLFALSRIEADAAWFLEHGVLSSGKARAVRRLVNRLCGEVRPQAVALVDAFSIPDGLLAAPIARR